MENSIKQCSVCKIEQTIDQFAWRNKANNNRHSSCHECRREQARESYNRNKSKVVQSVTKRNKHYLACNKLWKSKLSCCNCSETSTPCLDFHHLDASTKLFAISQMMGMNSLKTIIKEAKKCVVVCANCHRKIHAGEISLELDIINKSKSLIIEAYNATNTTYNAPVV